MRSLDYSNDGMAVFLSGYSASNFAGSAFMLPGMDMVRTGLAGLDHRVRHGTGGGVILQ